MFALHGTGLVPVRLLLLKECEMFEVLRFLELPLGFRCSFLLDLRRLQSVVMSVVILKKNEFQLQMFLVRIVLFLKLRLLSPSLKSFVLKMPVFRKRRKFLF